jgi:hypothetical protein
MVEKMQQRDLRGQRPLERPQGCTSKFATVLKSKTSNFRQLKPSEIRSKPSEITYFRWLYYYIRRQSSLVLIGRK